MASLNILATAARPPLLADIPLLWLQHLPKARDHASAHSLLRGILAHYLACPPAAVPLRHTPDGAPEITGHPLAVSLAYADEMLLLGVCQGARIGVDLLRIQPMPDWREVATLFLGPQICAELATHPAPQRDAAFARHWVELEARGKCLGLGLQEYTPGRATRLNDKIILSSNLDCGRSDLCAAVAIRR